MELTPSLNLRSATMMVVGNVVGAGIFTTSGFLASGIDHPLVFIAVWILGGLLTLSGALTYSELSAMYPEAGGDYQYLKKAYHPLAGFLVGWLLFLIIMPGSIAALSMALINNLPLELASPWAGKGLAVGVIAALTLLNMRGTKASGNTQDLVTIGSIVLILTMIVLGIAGGKGNWNNFAPTPENTLKIGGGGALLAVIFTYSGWFSSCYIANEIKEPQKNLPRSLLIGTLIITLIYTAINGLYLYAMPLAEMAGLPDVAIQTVERLFSGAGSKIVSSTIFLAILSCINATVMSGARVTYAMSSDQLFFKPLKDIHPRTGTPVKALCVQAAIATILVASGSFGQLLSWVGFAMLLTSMATGAAVIVLRIKNPDAHRPFKVPGYPVVPLIFVLTYIAIAVIVTQATPRTSLLSLTFLLSGVPVYLFFQMKHKKTEPKPMQK